MREDVPPEHKLRQRSQPRTQSPLTHLGNVTDDQSTSASTAVTQSGVPPTQQPLPQARSSSPSPSASSLTSSSGSTIVPDEVNSDG